MPTPLLGVALDLCSNVAAIDRYERLLEAVRGMLPCDSAALLELVDDELLPVITVGLRPEVLGRRFRLRDHPRLAQILGSSQPTRFTAASALPDPFDGLLEASRGLTDRVHACIGTRLEVEGEVVGALAVDALDPHAFDEVDDDTIAVLGALAAAALRTARLVDALEYACAKKGVAAEELLAEVQARRGGDVLGESPATRRLRDDIAMVARSDLTVLVIGETGTGKELVARALHRDSERAGQPLIYVNCSALPESSAESELFGHVAGAFPGAAATRVGKIEAADHGTLLLDEVSELAPAVQAKLLRVLRTGEVQRVGADYGVKIDVRVVAVTNRELPEVVRAGRFRPDLYHRLSVYPIRVPPLRERVDDIPHLAGHFLEQARQRLGLTAVRLTSAAYEALEVYEWPGNVRELEHVVLRATLRAARLAKESGDEGVIVHHGHLGLGTGPAVFEPVAPALDGSRSLRDVVDGFQRQVVAATLDASGGNWSECARRLDVDRGNLHRLARRLGLKD